MGCVSSIGSKMADDSVVVKIRGEAPQISDTRLDDPLRVQIQGASTAIPEPTRRRSKEVLDGKRVVGGGGGGESREGEEEATECSSNAKFRRRSKRAYFNRTKSRLEDPNWVYDRMGKSSSTMKDEDWLFDEDFLEVTMHLKKVSPLTVVQWASLLLIMVILVCTLTIDKLKRGTLWDLPLWKWEILILVIICGQLVSGWGIRGIVFFVERKYIFKIRVLYFVYGMRQAVQKCIWLSLVLIAWHFLVAEKIGKESNRRILNCISKILICLLVGSLTWLLKTLIVKVLASSFHVSAFFERIKVSLFKQYVIKKLQGPRLDNEHSDEDDERVNDEAKNNSKSLRKSTTVEHLQQLNKKNVSAVGMKRLISLVQSGVISNLSTLDEDLPDSTDEDESSLRTRDEYDAKLLSKSIFRRVAKEGTKYIFLADLKHYIREDKVKHAMDLFGATAQKGRISEADFTNWMVEAFRERRTIALSLDDTKTAVDDLHQMLNVIVSIIIVIIWLIIFGVAISHFLIFISSQVLVAVFVFGNTCKTVFEAIIFLFVMHPYDVGDRCEIDGVQMEVEEMNILTTVFRRFDQQIIIYPNIVLATKPIGNYFRSPAMVDQIEFSIHISTPWEKIDKMKKKIIGYIEKNSDHWFRDPTLVIKDVDDMNRLKMVVWPRHQINHQDMGLRWKRRAALLEEMIKIFSELDIEYRMLPLDMNLRIMPRLTSERLPSNWRTCDHI